MVRAGVGSPVVMQLLGHKSPHMTLEYFESPNRISSAKFHLARSHPRHLAPSRTPSSASPPRADLAGTAGMGQANCVHWTAIVTPACVELSPVVKTIGIDAPDARPAGICTLICCNPVVKPGAC